MLGKALKRERKTKKAQAHSLHIAYINSIQLENIKYNVNAMERLLFSL